MYRIFRLWCISSSFGLGIMIEPLQIRGARALIGMRQRDLASAAGISLATLNNIERNVMTNSRYNTITAIQVALENAGIIFMSSDHESDRSWYHFVLKTHQETKA